jgi:prepilin-type N-terminal cleavage/methylation domain-containing protein
MKNAFTLLELLIVIGILVILIGATIAAINPGRQFAKANNARRWSDISVLLNAVLQNIIDNKGVWVCPDYSEITTSTDGAFIASTTEAILQAPICNCLLPRYLPALPQDPRVGNPLTACPATYNTRYKIYQDATTSRITIFAPDAQSENGAPPDIRLTR